MFGINVLYDGCEKFIDICYREGISEIRLHCPFDCSIKPILDKLSSLGMKAYVVPLFDLDGTGLPLLLSMYEKVFDTFPTEITSGISLPESSAFHQWLSRYKRSSWANFVNDVSLAGEKRGHKVVMPLLMQDVDSGEWFNSKVSAFDIQIFIGGLWICDLEKISKIVRDCPKDVWVGNAGKYGGWLTPSQQVNTLEVFAKFKKTSGVKKIFLASGPSSRFHWSIGEEFLVDVKTRTIRPEKSGRGYEKREGLRRLSEEKVLRRSSKLEDRKKEDGKKKKTRNPSL